MIEEYMPYLIYDGDVPHIELLPTFLGEWARIKDVRALESKIEALEENIAKNDNWFFCDICVFEHGGNECEKDGVLNCNFKFKGEVDDE